MTKFISLLTSIYLSVIFNVFAENEQTEKLNLPKCNKLKSQRFWSNCLGEAELSEENDHRWAFYTGPFLEGKPHGYGLLKVKNGDSYEGDFQNGRFWGRGVYYFSNGVNMSGEFEDDYPVRGAMLYPDGSSYVGDFFGWQYHGQGQLVISGNKWAFKGNWEHGYPSDGTVTLENGDTFSGKLKDYKSTEEGVGRRADGSSGPATLNSKFDTATQSLIFEIVWSFNPADCDKFMLDRTENLRSGGELPRSVGPIRLGMSVKEFECVAGRKLLPCEIPEGGIFENNVDYPVCKGSGTWGLFKEGNVMIRNTELGKEYVAITGDISYQQENIKKLSGDIWSYLQTLFYNDSLFVISITKPAVGPDYLESKYGPAQFHSFSKSVTCRDSAGLTRDLSLSDKKWVWKSNHDLRVEFTIYENYLDGDPSCVPVTSSEYRITDEKSNLEFLSELNEHRTGVLRRKDDLGF